MLTGDAEAVGKAVAESLGLDGYHAGLLPADKVSHVERLLSEQPLGSVLAFVGDGINDAPVLARADLGIAMGGLGSDAAIEAADIVLMDDKPSKIARAVRIARKTVRIANENTYFAIGVKLLVLLLAAAGLATMWMAVLADVGVTKKDVVEVLALYTGINVGELEKGEGERLMTLEDELHKRVAGQDRAVNAVAKAIRRNRAGLRDPKRPIGIFLFTGPSGGERNNGGSSGR